MILKALYDYYERRADLPQYGIELKEIGYLIVIDRDGNFLRLESRMENKTTARTFSVLQAVKRSGKHYIPNYLWDNYEYVIGGEGESSKKHLTFVESIESLQARLKDNEYVDAICKFYHNYGDLEEVLRKDALFDSMLKSTKYISFLLQGELKIAAEDETIKRAILNQVQDDISNDICLITGNKQTVARLHTSIRLNKDTGPLVSFQKNRGYDSYGKQQGFNAPISADAEYKYTTALNAMLASGSHNKFMVGTRTFVFWASSCSEAATQAEESIFSLLGIPDSNADDPDAKTQNVRKVFTAIYSGSLKTSLDDKFFILGLAPNSARIAVVYWAETTLRDFAGLILKHFADMDIIDTRKEKRPYAGVREMLSAVTLGGKQADATPNLPEAIVKSIFQGTPYPFTLFSACIRRIRAESSDGNAVRVARAAIIKAYLNRLNDNNKQLTNMLDKTNTNPGYVCGRLFAVLDKIQEDASHVSSIRERYMNSASATPSAVFATILNLSAHHAEKLNERRRIYFEKLKQEIVDKISADGFPAHLDLQDQGRFFVGYYHQRQDFFTKNEETEENKQ